MRRWHELLALGLPFDSDPFKGCLVLVLAIIQLSRKACWSVSRPAQLFRVGSVALRLRELHSSAEQLELSRPGPLGGEAEAKRKAAAHWQEGSLPIAARAAAAKDSGDDHCATQSMRKDLHHK